MADQETEQVWNQGEVRKVGAELAFTTLEVFDSLMPLVEELPFEIGPVESTAAVREIFVRDNISVAKRENWHHAEEWVQKYLRYLNPDNTPPLLDLNIQGEMEVVQYFGSTRDAEDIWKDSRKRIRGWFSILQKDIIDPMAPTVGTYTESRLLRYATLGHFLVRPEAAIIIEPRTN